MKTQVSIVALACLGTFGCKKDADKTSDVNEQGEYFNCRIEGRYWTFEQEHYTAHDALSAYGAHDRFFIHADRVDDYPQTGIEFTLNGRSLPDRDTYILGKNTSNGVITGNEAFARITGPTANFSGYDFATDSTHQGMLIFTRCDARRAEGTFWFNAGRTDTNAVIHVTDGRFSISRE